MTEHGNPVLSPWADTGSVPPPPSSQRPMPNPARVSPETKRIIGELGMKYPASAGLSPQDHAAQLALLCVDLIDIPPNYLRQAASIWSREQKWMPKASELREIAYRLANPPERSTEAMWQRRVDEGNAMIVAAKQERAMRWVLNDDGNGIRLEAVGRAA
jgi:hypothetical protein